jgi:CheY-like chemotaxis protein
MAGTEKRVLIVDDDEPIRKLLSVVLRRRGVVSDLSADGAEAWGKLERCRYSLILLDLMMPRMNGFELIEKLGALDPAVRPSIIVLTAGARPENLPQNTVLAIVRKPFDVDIIADVVVATLSSAQVTLQPGNCPEADSETLFPQTETAPRPPRTN